MTSPLQQKLKLHGPSVVTANRLGDGAVVYRTEDGEWTTMLDAAAIVTTADEATVLLAAAKADGVRAVDVYVAPVKLERDRVLPGNLRELIRLRGPTVDLPITFGI
jgi:predicted NAD/FAD-binding protein